MAQQPFQSVGQIITKRPEVNLNGYRVVKSGSDRELVNYPASGAEVPLGVTRPAQGGDASPMVLAHTTAVPKVIDVAIEGIVAVEYGATVAIDDFLVAAADGSGKAIPTTTGGHNVIGIATEAGVDGDIGAVHIQKSRY